MQKTPANLWLERLEDRCLLAVTVGALGDSYTDETGPRAGIPNWVEILSAASRADFGPLRGDYAAGDPRRGSGQSFEYNFALGGARASGFAGCGNNQQTGCALGGAPRFRSYAVSGQLEYGVQEIAGNDFIQDGIFGLDFLVLPFPLYPPGVTLFNDTKSAYVNGLNLATANGTAPVRMLLGNLPDLGTFPFASFLPPAQRDILRTWIIAWNNEVALQALTRGYGVLDLWGLWEQFRTTGGTTVHGIPVNAGTWNGQGGPQGMRNFFLNDGLHGTPIAHAFLANQFLANLNAAYGTDIPLLTPKEMVTLSLLDPQQPPVAQTPGPYVVTVGGSLTVSAKGSTDPNPGDRAFLRFTWDLNGDQDFTDAVGPQPRLSWKDLQALGIAAGNTYPVRVRVDDTFGGVTVSVPADLRVLAPYGPGDGFDAYALADLETGTRKKSGMP